MLSTRDKPRVDKTLLKSPYANSTRRSPWRSTLKVYPLLSYFRGISGLVI